MKNNKNAKGQILVAAVFLMFLSLALGMSMSSGFIKNIKVQTQADDFSKAQYAAEALIERLLLVSNDTLEDYIDGNSCGTACTWQVTDTTGQIISASASLSYAGNSPDEFETQLSTTDSYHLNLKSYTSGKTLEVCWSTPASIYASYIRTSSNIYTSKAYAYNAANTSYPDNGLPLASANHGYTSCFTVTATNTPIALRLKSYYLNTNIRIIPQAGEALPKQGVVIKAMGKSGDASKEVTVLKSTETLPSIFDYAIYQKSPDDPLSNVTL